MIRNQLFVVIGIVITVLSCSKNDVKVSTLLLERALIGSTELDINGGSNDDMPTDQVISLEFSSAVDWNTVDNAFVLSDAQQQVDVSITVSSGNRSVALFPLGALQNNVMYTLVINDELKGAKGESFGQVSISFRTIVGDLQVIAVKIGDRDITGQSLVLDVPLEFSMEFEFSDAVDEASFENAVSFIGKEPPDIAFDFSTNSTKVTVTGLSPLNYLSKFLFEIDNSLSGVFGEGFEGYAFTFYSALDQTPKFPAIPAEELLTKVQEYAFKYFWDFGHPVSGLTRERNTSIETVTSGGSGFGMMVIIAGIERSFISRPEGINRLRKMIQFLEQADRFHGAWSHWLSGSTGEVIPFSAKDDGGDLVETSYVVMGMLTVRQYLNDADAAEAALIDKINSLVNAVEWDWYTQGEKSLTWHWSPNFGFEKNLKIRGWNEALITYVLAASSSTHGITTEVYENGWKNSANFINGKNFYGIKLPLGIDYGGPLFFEQYTYLGIDPRNLRDDQVDYWEQGVNHSLINREHCVVNPKNYVGYNEDCWGLTASDGNNGYSAHSPTNDRGVITPTAALSSFPFTPEESMAALEHFYYMLGDRLWGPYGFYDAFNITDEWYASSNIAIDQGPLMIMIENHRTALLWNLFMSCPEVAQALDALGFTY